MDSAIEDYHRRRSLLGQLRQKCVQGLEQLASSTRGDLIDASMIECRIAVGENVAKRHDQVAVRNFAKQRKVEFSQLT